MTRVLTRRAVLRASVWPLAALLPARMAWAAARTPPPGGLGPPPAKNAARGELIQKARSWVYQLQNYEFDQLASSNADILVLDYSISGTDKNRLTADAVRRLQLKKDGSRRLVLAYLCIGEAEEYRYYWKPEWLTLADTGAGPQANPPTPQRPTANPFRTKRETQDKPSGRPALNPPSIGDAGKSAGTDAPARPKRSRSPLAPAWLGEENEAWSGNFKVRYEHPEWQSIFLEGEQSYLARIIAAGFDGVYLDRVDAFYDERGSSPDPARDMAAFVERIAATARRMAPEFLVVPQNAEELLKRPGYVELINAIAKEDLLYGNPAQAQLNSADDIASSVALLEIARRKGRPVLAVEYLDDASSIASARLELQRLGYIPTFAPRLLDHYSPDAEPPPSNSPKQP